jgi:hypothetical protein
MLPPSWHGQQSCQAFAGSIYQELKSQLALFAHEAQRNVERAPGLLAATAL